MWMSSLIKDDLGRSVAETTVRNASGPGIPICAKKAFRLRPPEYGKG